MFAIEGIKSVVHTLASNWRIYAEMDELDNMIRTMAFKLGTIARQGLEDNHGRHAAKKFNEEALRSSVSAVDPTMTLAHNTKEQLRRLTCSARQCRRVH